VGYFHLGLAFLKGRAHTISTVTQETDMHINAKVITFAAQTTGTVADRMNQMGKKFESATPAQLAVVLHTVGAITYAERQNIEENGFIFDQPGLEALESAPHDWMEIQQIGGV
jgi:hypothetical protein